MQLNPGVKGSLSGPGRSLALWYGGTCTSQLRNKWNIILHELLESKTSFRSSPRCSIATWFLLFRWDKASLLAISECLNVGICCTVYCGFVFLYIVSVKYWYISNYFFNLIKLSANFISANKQFTLPDCAFRSFIWNPNLHSRHCFLLPAEALHTRMMCSTLEWLHIHTP